MERFFVNGQWMKPGGSKHARVLDSYTEEEFAEVALGDPQDIDVAVHAARAAFSEWSRSTPAERGAMLGRIRDSLAKRSGELAVTITREVGMPLKMATRMQVAAPLAILDMYSRRARDCRYEEQIGNSRVLREAAGVVGAIIAWNYPLYLLVSKVAPALAAGCTVVLKPSELAPLSAIAFAEACEEAGLPAGVFNLVIGEGAVAGESLVRHPEIDAVTFTGSTRAGRRVGELALASVKRIALELGGKSASVVLRDADLAAAVKTTVNMCFLNSGQTCAALTRLLVPVDRYDETAALATEFASGFTCGDPQIEGTKLGPLVSALQRDRVLGYIRRGISAGADLLWGGLGKPENVSSGFFVKPTVFGRVNTKSVIAQEEIFGPVLCIIPYSDEEEAINIANDSIYGLSGAVWSGDEAHAESVARRLRTGQVDINGGSFNLEAPFGGYKQSGVGREMGRFAMEEFLQYKSIQMRTKP